ncbi:unnamed protein product [Boreogadus saida]
MTKEATGPLTTGADAHSSAELYTIVPPSTELNTIQTHGFIRCVLLTGGESIAATLAHICMALIGRPTSSCEVGLLGDTKARVSASRWGRGLVQGQ